MISAFFFSGDKNSHLLGRWVAEIFVLVMEAGQLMIDQFIITYTMTFINSYSSSWWSWPVYSTYQLYNTYIYIYTKTLYIWLIFPIH